MLLISAVRLSTNTTLVKLLISSKGSLNIIVLRRKISLIPNFEMP